ncbi:unnamed protein product [Echinostoma caproni]|uniref:SPT6_acidic domain-containing protein n=1 Tax=Echinostoma caproni TaxID=27848 RepID=A0A183BG46_9TREM|nr:unnamed protein product [Echinostoma caproni]
MSRGHRQSESSFGPDANDSDEFEDDDDFIEKDEEDEDDDEDDEEEAAREETEEQATIQLEKAKVSLSFSGKWRKFGDLD